MMRFVAGVIVGAALVAVGTFAIVAAALPAPIDQQRQVEIRLRTAEQERDSLRIERDWLRHERDAWKGLAIGKPAQRID